jgi:predicted RNA binding protein YcfA (HicA-like mRNA interferase family)
MADRLPQVTGTSVLRALMRDGWREDRRSGSHVILVHPLKSRHVTVPIHRGKTLPLGTLRQILNQAGLSTDSFRRLL